MLRLFAFALFCIDSRDARARLLGVHGSLCNEYIKSPAGQSLSPAINSGLRRGGELHRVESPVWSLAGNEGARGVVGLGSGRSSGLKGDSGRSHCECVVQVDLYLQCPGQWRHKSCTRPQGRRGAGTETICPKSRSGGAANGMVGVGDVCGVGCFFGPFGAFGPVWALGAVSDKNS